MEPYKRHGDRFPQANNRESGFCFLRDYFPLFCVGASCSYSLPHLHPLLSQANAAECWTNGLQGLLGLPSSTSVQLALQSCFPIRDGLSCFSNQFFGVVFFFLAAEGGGLGEKWEKVGQPLGVPWNVLAGDLASWVSHLTSLSLSFLLGSQC